MAGASSKSPHFISLLRQFLHSFRLGENPSDRQGQINGKSVKLLAISSLSKIAHLIGI
jgi:hypothetical protein